MRRIKTINPNLKATNYKLQTSRGITFSKKKQTGFTFSKEKQTGFTFSKEKQTGFTVIELVIYIGLLTMLILVFTDIFASIIQNQLSSRNTSSVADDGRYIYSRFIYDVNRASSIDQPLNFGDTSSNLILTIDGQQYSYSQNGNNLVIQDPTGTYQLNGFGSKITNLSFTKIGASTAKDTIRINFTISGTVNKQGIIDTENFQTTAGLR